MPDVIHCVDSATVDLDAASLEVLACGLFLSACVCLFVCVCVCMCVCVCVWVCVCRMFVWRVSWILLRAIPGSFPAGQKQRLVQVYSCAYCPCILDTSESRSPVIPGRPGATTGAGVQCPVVHDRNIGKVLPANMFVQLLRRVFSVGLVCVLSHSR